MSIVRKEFDYNKQLLWKLEDQGFQEEGGSLTFFAEVSVGYS